MDTVLDADPGDNVRAVGDDVATLDALAREGARRMRGDGLGGGGRAVDRRARGGVDCRPLVVSERPRVDSRASVHIRGAPDVSGRPPPLGSNR